MVGLRIDLTAGNARGYTVVQRLKVIRLVFVIIIPFAGCQFLPSKPRVHQAQSSCFESF